MDKTLSTPVTVEHDGWTLSSGSSDQPTEAALKAALGMEPPGSTPPTETEVAAKPAAVAAEPTSPPEITPDKDQPAETQTDQPPPGEAGSETPIAETPPKRKAHDPQRRIDQQHAAKANAEALLAAERERSARLERELAEARRPPVAAQPTPPVATVVPPKPKPVWAGPEGYEAQGKTWEDFQGDYDAWNHETIKAETERLVEARFAAERTKTEAARTAAVQQGQQAAAEAVFLQRVETARAKHPDYDVALDNLGDLDSPALKHLIYFSEQGPEIGYHLAHHVEEAEVLVDLFGDEQHRRFTRPLVDALQRSPIPAKVLSYFAAHPDEFRRLIRMDPIAAIAGIGRLEARLDVAPSVTTAAAPPVTSARPPLRTVSGGAPLTRTTRAVSTADDLEFGPDYIARANQEEAAALQRRRGF